MQKLRDGKRGMRLRWLIAGLIALAPLPAMAGDQDCLRGFAGRTNYPHSDVRLSSHQPPVKVDHTRSRSSLTEEMNAHSAATQGSITSGLTYAEQAMDFQTSMSVIALQDGSHCVWPEKVLINLGYSELTIFVGREFAPGSCQYETTLQHERVHVDIIQANLRRYRGIIEQAMRHHLATTYPRKIRSGFDPQQESISDMQDLLTREMKRMDRELRAAHAELDSPESYAYWTSLCDAW